MRKLIVSNIVSLDGYVAGPGADVTALPMDNSFDTYNAELLSAADTVLLGRRSYELLKGFWPPVAEDPEATPAEREVSRLENALEKVVISDTLTEEGTAPWRDTTRIVPRGAAHQHVAELRRAPGEGIVVFGSRTLWNDLLAAGLVDELHLMIGPVILGGGTPAFGDNATARLDLLDTRTFDDSDNLVVRYAVAAARSA